MARFAVVLFNLGGPDSLDAVEPFLFNLFDDPAIIDLPGFLRHPLAKFVSWRRGPEARAIYGNLGGRSPLLDETEAQARTLERALEQGRADGTGNVVEAARVFIAMRYWHPLAEAAAREVKAFNPDVVVLLPLYPQFSTTTTGSSVTDWHRAAAAAGLEKPTRTVCCYPTDPGLVRAHAALIGPAITEAKSLGKPRVLFSAHGLPKKVIAGGDPYQWQVEQTATAVAAELALPRLDWTVCYQSRVGPLEWIGPAIDDELVRAAKDRVPVVVVPIAFVSEHSETLVELDIQYRDRARALDVPAYVRVPAVAVQPEFIAGLAEAVRGVQAHASDICAAVGSRLCPAGHGQCPMTGAG